MEIRKKVQGLHLKEIYASVEKQYSRHTNVTGGRAGSSMITAWFHVMSTMFL